MIGQDFASELPDLLVGSAASLGLDPKTRPEGIQVMVHAFGPYDVNVPNIWVKIQLSDDRSVAPGEQRRIRDRLYDLLVGWFTIQEYAPGDFVMDLMWGPPTNGRGTVGGALFVW